MKTESSISRDSVFTSENIYFSENNAFVAMPAWGKFFINIGRWIAEKTSQNSRYVIGLSIPVRNYAAALTAFGVVQAKSVNYQINISNQAKFDKFCNLRNGRRVLFNYNNNEWIEAVFDGVCKDYKDPLLKIKVKSNNYANKRSKQTEPDTTHFVSKQDINKITLFHNPAINNIAYKKTQTITVNEFLNCCLNTNCGIHVYTKAKLDCYLIGNIKILKDEITKAKFAYSSNNKFKIGTLQDVLRVRNFLQPSDIYAYTTEVVSSFSNTLPVFTEIPYVTIFDGASGFIKWRDNCYDSNQIVLLERTEKRFEEAVNIINYEYINRVNTEKIKNFPSPPPGVEIIVYQRV